MKNFLPTAFLLCGAIAVLAPAAGPDADRFTNRIDKRILELQPTRTERKIDEIGWAPSILEAERLARLHRRPVFLLTHDGRIGTGRC
ncbi:MAG: hypothetical protein ABIZ80_18840 [Bryobacteraceae bacterium]